MRTATLWLVTILCPGCAARTMRTVVDDAAPEVRVVEPAQGARIQTATPTIEIEYADNVAGIQVVSFKAVINGRDYSSEFDHHSSGAIGQISASRRLPLGENVLNVEIADRAGNTTRVQSKFINAAGGWLTVTADAGAEARKNIELILDASGSMEDALGVSTRMDVAKSAVRELVESLPSGTALGLRVFRGCDGIAPLVPIRAVDKLAYVAKVRSIKPAGGTPIVASLLQSFEALSRMRDGQRIAILVTDGGESCDGKVDQAIAAAKDAATRVIVIGFDIKDAGITAELQKLAESTGGAFYDAGDQTALQQALQRSVLRLGYVVLGVEGDAVVEGDVGGEHIELPLGTYKMRLQIVPALVVSAIRIGSLTETTVRLRRGASGLQAEILGPIPTAGSRSSIQEDEQ